MKTCTWLGNRGSQRSHDTECSDWTPVVTSHALAIRLWRQSAANAYFDVQVAVFWANAKKVVGLKVSSAVEQRKKAIMDEQLDKMVGQTEKYSKMLALNLKPDSPEPAPLAITEANPATTSAAAAAAVAKDGGSAGISAAAANPASCLKQQPLLALEAAPAEGAALERRESLNITKQKSVSFAAVAAPAATTAAVAATAAAEAGASLAQPVSSAAGVYDALGETAANGSVGAGVGSVDGGMQDSDDDEFAERSDDEEEPAVVTRSVRQGSCFWICFAHVAGSFGRPHDCLPPHERAAHIRELAVHLDTSVNT